MTVGHLYRYVWGNNAKRAQLKGRVCRVLARGALNSALVQFIDDPAEMGVVSRNALRRVREEQDVVQDQLWLLRLGREGRDDPGHQDRLSILREPDDDAHDG